MIDQLPATLAAVDLGSNSFHMIVVETNNGHFQVVDKIRDMVRLAAGLNKKNVLDDDTIDRAIKTLERFGERLRDMEDGSVRIVGTNTLRKARNIDEFLSRAEAAVGHPIDIIAGSEEARLIYLGVSHGLEDESERRLVIDIGGGSTEFIVGRHFEPLLAESLHIGCVSMSNRFFADGRITEKAFTEAVLHARQEIEPIEEKYRSTGWQTAIGASGTNLAIYDVVMANNWSKEGITADALKKLKTALIVCGSIENVNFSGLSSERKPVFVGGVAILYAAFDALGIEQLRISDSALREGLLYDLLGRIQHEDVREQTIESLIDRYQVDRPQADRVFLSAKDFLTQVAEPWALEDENSLLLLRWSSFLHEIGRSIAHSQYQKHGEYLLANMDMPGFARGEQRRLAALVRLHRRKLSDSVLATFAGQWREKISKLTVLLRLSVVLHRRRSVLDLPGIKIKTESKTIKLTFPSGWLDEHPLTEADLSQEAAYLKAANFKLKFK
ncbi:MAG: exopolyphosphatase [Gammaproteobacteria bacterium]